MDNNSMTMKILLPYKIFLDLPRVLRIVAETRDGSFGILPNRLDCVAALEPGILTYETYNGEELYVAVDEGILVKTGATVLISVRNAIGGLDLGQLRAAVEKEFVDISQREQDVRSVLKKLESGFVNRLARYYHG